MLHGKCTAVQFAGWTHTPTRRPDRGEGAHINTKMSSAGKNETPYRRRRAPNRSFPCCSSACRACNKNIAVAHPRQGTHSSSSRRSSRCLHALVLAILTSRAQAWLLAPRRVSTVALEPSSSLHAGRCCERRGRQSKTRELLRIAAGDAKRRGNRVFMFPTMATQDGQEQEEQGEPLWLGLDLSTQSLTAAVLRGDGVGGTFNEPILLESINYENDLPVEQRYGSKNGMKVVDEEVTSPVAMWLHALEALLQRLKNPEGKTAAIDLSAVRGVSVSGQQHGTVYWAKGSQKRLEGMAEALHGDESESNGGGGSDDGLAEAFAGCFAVEDSPIWADGSTEKYASELEESMGGAARLAELTGSRAHLRQGAPQIMKIHRERPEAYDNTERISLVCSFLASVLAGRYAEIETSDGSGMNLMHIREKRWVEEALEATAPSLRSRLGGDEAIVDSHLVVGNVCGYLCRRFGFSRDCVVVAGSGDNCNSLAGMGVVPSRDLGVAAAAEGAEGQGAAGGGDVMVSLGTSDTLLGVTTDPSPTTTGNTMYHPCDPAAWFVMLVYKNGSLTREAVRDRRAGGSWDAFSRLLRDGRPGNGGKLGLFLDLFEITPQINRQGNFVVDAEDRQSAQGELSAEEEVRAVVEGRFLSMKAHARELGVAKPERVLATGGGSNNAELLQVLADVFQAPVFTAAASDSAAIGAALRAKHGVEGLRRGVPYVPFAEVYGESDMGEPVAVPSPDAGEAYAGMVDRMDALEQRVMFAKVEGGGSEEGKEAREPVAPPSVPAG